MVNSTIVIEHEKSDDNGADQVSDAPSPEHFMPRTPEYSYDALSIYDIGDAGFTTHAFVQAGIPPTSKGMSLHPHYVDSFPLTCSQTCQTTTAPQLPSIRRATSSLMKLTKPRRLQQALASMAGVPPEGLT